MKFFLSLTVSALGLVVVHAVASTDSILEILAQQISTDRVVLGQRAYPYFTELSSAKAGPLMIEAAMSVFKAHSKDKNLEKLTPFYEAGMPFGGGVVIEEKCQEAISKCAPDQMTALTAFGGPNELFDTVHSLLFTVGNYIPEMQAYVKDSSTIPRDGMPDYINLDTLAHGIYELGSPIPCKDESDKLNCAAELVIEPLCKLTTNYLACLETIDLKASECPDSTDFTRVKTFCAAPMPTPAVPLGATRVGEGVGFPDSNGSFANGSFAVGGTLAMAISLAITAFA